jgi:hypothetical protein
VGTTIDIIGMAGTITIGGVTVIIIVVIGKEK